MYEDIDSIKNQLISGFDPAPEATITYKFIICKWLFSVDYF